MDKIMGVVRHVIGMAGAVLVALGISEAAQISDLVTNLEAVAGAVMTIVAIGASILAKLKGFKLFGGTDTAE